MPENELKSPDELRIMKNGQIFSFVKFFINIAITFIIFFISKCGIENIY